MTSSRKTVIIGSGVFGLSTAYHLLQRGWSDITVIDRSETLPAPDGASNDINRIVRTSYSDPFYCELAKDAIAAWKDTELWSDTYHESGVLVVGSAARERDYVRKAHANDIAHGLRVTPTDTPDALRAVFPEDADVGDLAGHYTYFGLDGGWANAGQGVSLLIGKVRAMGGRVLGGKDVAGLVREGGKTVGVRCRDGSVLDASLVVLATGSWTCSAFPDTAVSKLFQATGQVVAMVQLTSEEAEVYRKCPVVLDFDSGFYVFPPNEQNILKMAIHAAGFTHSIGDGGISTPRTIKSDPETGLRIPKASVVRLRDGLRAVYPTLATKPFCATRLCWSLPPRSLCVQPSYASSSGIMTRWTRTGPLDISRDLSRP
ncbi:unnamed protein product [Mycena citricolor]|uniref:FAD dependent oxidoreductase domain-containing protein n=1 Tax=Mycena citricolor TaxID=2018698 RepID=A0AAD2HTY3_9AGAR|nr:unnamed protein product [Mycena citricolor]